MEYWAAEFERARFVGTIGSHPNRISIRARLAILVCGTVCTWLVILGLVALLV